MCSVRVIVPSRARRQLNCLRLTAELHATAAAAADPITEMIFFKVTLISVLVTGDLNPLVNANQSLTLD